MDSYAQIMASTLHWGIIQVSVFLIDYIIAHDMAHKPETSQAEAKVMPIRYVTHCQNTGEIGG